MELRVPSQMLRHVRMCGDARAVQKLRDSEEQKSRSAEVQKCLFK